MFGHTNISDIYKWSLPLWYDGVSPAKVNLGLAYYARGYTLVDSDCKLGRLPVERQQPGLDRAPTLAGL